MSSSQSRNGLQGLMTSAPAMVLGALAIFAAVIWATVWMRESGDNQGSAPGATAPASGTQLAAGPVRVAGVEVLEPISDAGRVPLNTPVERTWRLRNTGTVAVKLGRPGIQVLEGC